jgi:catechol 2,3-dioxygenase
MTAAATLPERTRIGRVALVVTDLEATTAFYRNVVGLAVHTCSDSRATLGAGETPLLVLERDEEAPPRRRAQAGLFHTAFLYPSRSALGAALERVRNGWRLDGASDHHVSEALYLTDPEGNGVELYADRRKAAWPRNDDGTVRIGTEPIDLDDVAARSDGSGRAPPETTVGHIHLESTSIEAARAFYAETLGLRVQTEAPSALFLAAGEYHHHLGINVWNGRSRPAGGRGLAWFEFVVPDDSALVTARRRLDSAGVSIVAAADGVELSDPDGIEIRIRSA